MKDKNDIMQSISDAMQSHKVWHKFQKFIVNAYGKDLYGEWKFFNNPDGQKKPIKYRSFNEVKLSHRLHGHDVISRVKTYITKYCPEIRVLECDDDTAAGSIILLIPHPNYGISFMFIPQCTQIQNRFQMGQTEIKILIRSLTNINKQIFNKNYMKKYIRLLNYENACKVIDFINNNDERDYANITTGGVSMLIIPENLPIIESFIKSLNVRYEIGDISPIKVKEKIVRKLKSAKIIK